MYERMEASSQRLEWLGLTHRSSYEPMLRRIAGSDDIRTLRSLADVVEPVKDYTREETAPQEPTSLMPLNRLIDAARPESAAARHFSALVDELLAGQADSATKEQIRVSLMHWQNNQASLEPLAGQSFLSKEVIPLSQSLSQVASIGLQAMDDLDRGESPGDAGKAQELAVLQQAQQQKAQLLLMIVAPLQKLVEAAANQNPVGK
jgi:hexosaminidase